MSEGGREDFYDRGEGREGARRRDGEGKDVRRKGGKLWKSREKEGDTTTLEGRRR